MRLSCFEFGIDIYLKENKIDVLVIENQQLFTQFLEKLMQKEDDDFILFSEKGKRLSVHKYIEIVHSPFLIDLNSKRMLGHLHKELKEVSEEYFFSEKEQINSAIISYMDKLVLKVPYPILFHLGLDVIDLYKMYDVRMDFENLELMEKIIYYIQLEKMLCNTKVLIFVNLKAFLNMEQLQEVYKVAFYNKVQILLLEFAERGVLLEEKYCIIDKDKCVIQF